MEIDERKTVVAASTVPPAVAEDGETLAGQLRTLTHGVIEQELERLARKAPALTQEELQVISGALHELVERTVVVRASGLPHRKAQLRHLFGLAPSAEPVAGSRRPLSVEVRRLRGAA